MNTRVMRERLAVIYLTFFQFLKSAVSWYQQSKLEHIFHSFNENDRDQINGTISKIRDLVDKMHREGGLAGLAEGREIRFLVQQSLHSANRIEQQVKENDLKFQRQIDKLASTGQAARVCLEEICRNMMIMPYLRITSQGPSASQRSLERNNLQPLRLAMAAASQQSLRDKLLASSGHLDKHVFEMKDSHVRPSSDAVFANDLVVAKLSEWKVADNSQLLWLAEPPSLDLPSAMAIAATNTVPCASQGKVPYLAFYCQLPNLRTKLPQGTSRQQAATIGLVYSLIRQLLYKELVLAEISEGTCTDLGPERFQALDGTALKPALSILDALLDLAVPHLLCIIDGLDILQDECKAVLDVLRKHVKSGKPRVFKVLFTTSGTSLALTDCTELSDCHIIDTDPGQGGQVLGNHPPLWTGRD
ncbi:hypothetical protein VTN77DRAFT_4065 [Rasamsonia byssochlamydoides]|uniref:uncharacterized protein n=1 Tax=Rasamsonia byssochlamydoides TaxID=89139 RepID=UPI003742B9A6